MDGNPRTRVPRGAVLGWGSLVWDPRDLLIDREAGWQRGGPILPLEFSRKSSDGRLTLVIDPLHGVPLSTRFAGSTAITLADAIQNLASREAVYSTKSIGYLDVATRVGNARLASVLRTLTDWGRAAGLAYVVWTDLAPSEEFSLEWAFSYLTSLDGEKRDRAREYIARAPSEIETPLRSRLRSSGWLPID